MAGFVRRRLFSTSRSCFETTKRFPIHHSRDCKLVKSDDTSLQCVVHRQIPEDIRQQLNLTKELANSANKNIRHFSVSTGTYNWPSTVKEDACYGPSAKTTVGHDSSLRLSQFVVDFTHEYPQSKNFMYTKSSHSSPLPCIHVYPDNLKITFNTQNPTREQIRQVQTQWMSSEREHLDFITVEEVPKNTVHVYVCCHTARDHRCGVIGDALISSIREYVATPPSDVAPAMKELDVQCFGTSHVGGHNLAGNMIIYRPGWKQGVWYGRVSPCDVDDIFRETVIGGKVLGRYWRAGLPDGKWDPKEHISGEEAELRSEAWQEERCACQISG